MILLVVGLVAVIVVILIAVFLSIRLGRGDEHDDRDAGPGSRGRRHAGEEDWADRDARGGRTAARADDGHRRASNRGGYDVRSAARERDPQSRPARDRGYDRAPGRPGRPDGADYGDSPARRRQAPVAEPVGAPRRYDTGPSRRVGGGDFPSADYSSLDFSLAEYAAPDYPAADEPPTALGLAEPGPGHGTDRPDSRRKAPSGKSRSRQHRSKREDNGDWPSTEWDKLSDEQYWAELSADKPLATMARATPRAASPNTARPESRASSMPAMEEPVPQDSRMAAAPSAKRERGRDALGGGDRRPQREPDTQRLPARRRQQPTAPVARPVSEAPTASGPLAASHPSLDTGPYAVRDTGSYPAQGTGRHPSLDTGPYPAQGTGRHPSLDTGPYPAQGTGRHPSLDTGPHPARTTGSHRSPDTSSHAFGGGSVLPHDHDLAVLTGLAGGAQPPPVPGALDDDPLTSPSFSLKAVPATDSRSYNHARKNAQPTQGASYGSPGYADPGYANGAGVPQATAAETAPAQWYSAPPADVAPSPSYANPYSYPSADATGRPAPGVSQGHGEAGRGGSYLADPLHVYAPPAYEQPAPAYREPDRHGYQSLPGQSLPGLGMTASPADPTGHVAYPGSYPGHSYGPGQEQPETAYPSPAQPQPAPYSDGYDGAGYPPSYEGGYPGDPYAGGGYGTY
jgi:hypothetical protein